MTAATTRPPAPGELPRVLALARVQAFHWRSQLAGWTGTVAAVLVVLVLLSAPGGVDPQLSTTAALGLCIGSAAVHFQTILQTFPFALGLGATRRSFFLATVLVAATQAAVQATALTLLVQLELLTGGWWLSVRLVAVDPLPRLSAVEQWIVIAAVVLLAAMVFVLIGAVYQRWGWRGICVIAIAYVVLFPVIVIVGVSLARSDGGAALAAAVSSFPVLAGGPLALAALAGPAGYAVMRRTVA